MTAGERRFGTDGVRGRAGHGALAPEEVERLGVALAEMLAREADDSGPVVIGGDTRASRAAITVALARGLARRGLHAIDVGVLPTAGIALLASELGGSCAVVVSASHNPAEDNGIKVFSGAGHKFGDDEIRWIEERWRSLEPLSGESAPRIEPCGDAGERYVARLLRGLEDVDLGGLRLALDLAHGAASVVAPRLFERLGALVMSVGDAPDGANINAGCGSVHPEVLQRFAGEIGADLGLAVDGDADRSIFVDERGRIVDGDGVLALIGVEQKRRGRLPHATVVGTVLSNRGLERHLERHGIALERTAVGDRFVSRRMRDGGFMLGGEPSGHIIFGSELDYLGDGLYTALRVAWLLCRRGQLLGEALAGFERTPQREVSVRVGARPELEAIEGFKETLAQAEKRMGADGRILVRYSGTEPKVRVMVEGREEAVVQQVADDLAALLRERIGERR